MTYMDNEFISIKVLLSFYSSYNVLYVSNTIFFKLLHSECWVNIFVFVFYYIIYSSKFLHIQYNMCTNLWGEKEYIKVMWNKFFLERIAAFLFFNIPKALSILCPMLSCIQHKNVGGEDMLRVFHLMTDRQLSSPCSP